MNHILFFLSNYWEVKEPPARLGKKRSFWDKHGTLILSVAIPAGIILAILIFLIICFHIGGTDSGVWYNGGLA